MISVALSLRRLLALALILPITGCIGLFGPRDIDIPLSRLQTAVERKFPLSQNPMNLIAIQLDHPKVALQSADNRVSVTMDATVAPAFMRRSWRGNFTVSGLLQLDAARGMVLLAQPRMDKVTLDGVDPAVADQVARIGGVLAAQILSDTPLYTFGPADFRFGGSNFVPTRIVTKSDSLVVTFEPVK